MAAAIPLVDLKAQHRRLRADLLRAIEEVFDSGAFIQGARAAAFEVGFARAHGAAHAVGCASGTAALSLALEAAGVGAGDEVVTVAHTFIATAEAIVGAGATPVFVDIDPRTHTMDAAAAAAAVTPRTSAILPVHLNGVPCHMEALTDLARRHGLVLIEDCAQAHLATVAGRPVGTFGAAGAFSFFPGKNLGALGDAGLLAGDDAAVVETARKLLNHGRESKYRHDLVGTNARMDELQAAVLHVKLAHLTRWTERRRSAAAQYDARLRPLGFQVLESPPDARPVYHLYVVQVANRDEAARALAAADIGFGIHYPVPLHLQPAFASLGVRRGALPVTEAAADRILSLPMCGEIAAESVERVCDVLEHAARPTGVT